MKEPILKAVASPPKILWAPFLPSMLNLGMQFPFMFMAMGIFQCNPLLFMVSIVAGHMVCIGWGVKEPHLSAMIQAWGQANKTSTNLYKAKGNKFEP
ncbi:MAG: hypothetical protein R3Y43_06180 [Alphaproteobacteria bacterium]